MMMGVADMPIQTLKLLQIHPDPKSRKGKEKSVGSETTPSVASGGSERPQTQRGITSTSEVSLPESSNTPPAANLQPPPVRITRSNSDNTSITSVESPGTPTHRSTFMTQAFEESTGHSRSSSKDRSGTHSSSSCPIVERIHRHNSAPVSQDQRSQAGTAQGSVNFAESVETAMDTGKGLARIIGAGFKSPMDFSLNVAKGFHNVPKLYGADVRQVDKVTDLQSGLRTAAKVPSNPLCNLFYALLQILIK